MAAVAFGSFDVPESSDTEAGQDERAAAEDEAEAGDGDAAPAEEEVEEPAGIGNGQWEVGAEIEPGTYVTWAEGAFGCSVERLAGFSGDFEDTLAIAFLGDGARGRITIAEGDAGVEFTGDCVWTLE
jgi:hypothetical protein